MIEDVSLEGFYLLGDPDPANPGFFLGITADLTATGFFDITNGAVVGAPESGYFDPSAITRDYQFDCDGRVFGLGLPVEVNADGFQPGDATVRSQDTDAPLGGGQLFGRTELGGSTWLFNGFVNELSPGAAMSTLSTFATAWRRSYAVGEISVLRYRIGGRIRRVYGQSRRLAQTFDNRVISGMIGVSFTFNTIDAATYDDEERIVLIPFVSSAVGGLKSPLKSPLSTAVTAYAHGSIDTGGSDNAPFSITVYGPLGRGVIAGKGWTIALARTLTASDRVTVDTTPWGRGVYLNDQPTTGLLAPSSSRLADVRLSVGDEQIQFTGVDPTGTSAVEVRWHPTYSSI